MTEWFDKFGYIRTKKIYETSGNGVFYSTIALALGLITENQITFSMRGAMLKRNGENSYGNTSHDDYLGMAVTLLEAGSVVVARGVVLTFILNCFYMKNCLYDFGGKTWKEKLTQIWRPFLLPFPAWWITMLAAAFPNCIVRYVARFLLTALVRFSRLNLADASGTQLTWLTCYAVSLLGSEKPMKEFLLKIRSRDTSMAQVMSQPSDPYWDPAHPVIEGFAKMETELLGKL